MQYPLKLDALPRFARFAIAGCAGYGVDVTALYVAMYLLGTGPYLGRAISYLCASTSTWYMNRLFTFPNARSDELANEWFKFVLLNGFGGLVNYPVYAAYLQYIASSAVTPAVGVALGSLSGLGVNYLFSRKFVFKSPESPSAR